MQKKTPKRYALRLLWLLLIPAALLIKRLAGFSPSFVENVYSQGIYPVLMKPVSWLTGLFPLSLWEISLILLVIFIPVWIVVLIIRAIKRKSAKVFVPTLVNTVMILSIWFFMQTIMWNINYERYPFSQLAGLDVRPSSVDELYDLCEQLIINTNTLRAQVAEDENGVMTVPGGYQSVFDRTQIGFDNAALKYPFLAGRYGRPKPVMFSRLMSHTHIIGLYACITGEANIDVDIPDFDLASTVMHEMAHQRGFAREDEANYIAWVTCMAHPDPDFKYSASVMSLIYAMNALYGEDPDLYFALSKNYSEGLKRDLADSSTYWKQFQGTAQKVADIVNDTYIKLNGDANGVKSYGRMVDLLLAEYRKNSLKLLPEP